MIDFKIISTGSKGNAVVIDRSILIDCGVSAKALKEQTKYLNLVLLTHEHGDHFKKATIKKLAKDRPTLRFGCCEWLVEKLVACGVAKENIDVFETEKNYNYGHFTISPVKLFHDVPNCGYRLFFGEEKVLYVTDTEHLDGISAKDYTLYMVEANYTDDDIDERIKAKEEKGEFAYENRVKKTHLSKAQADNFIYANIGKESQYIYLHEHLAGELNDNNSKNN